MFVYPATSSDRTKVLKLCLNLNLTTVQSLRKKTKTKETIDTKLKTLKQSKPLVMHSSFLNVSNIKSTMS